MQYKLIGNVRVTPTVTVTCTFPFLLWIYNFFKKSENNLQKVWKIEITVVSLHYQTNTFTHKKTKIYSYGILHFKNKKRF